MKILVVDDENDIRAILDYSLKLNGFDVKCAKNAEVALELNETFLPTIVILDIMMDGIDGIELCKKLRKINPSIFGINIWYIYAYISIIIIFCESRQFKQILH